MCVFLVFIFTPLEFVLFCAVMVPLQCIFLGDPRIHVSDGVYYYYYYYCYYYYYYYS